MPHSRIVLRDTANADIIASFDNWRSFSWTRHLNATGNHTFSLDAADQRVSLFELDCIVQLLRKPNDNGDWYSEYIGLHRSTQYELTSRQQRIFTSYGRTPHDILNRRSIIYRAGSAQSDKSGVGETVIKEFIDENAGPGATAPPRLIAGVITQLAIEADAGGGTAWEGSVAWRNLLDIVQEIALSTGLDFDVVWTGTGYNFQFEMVNGTDHTSGSANPITFSSLLGNMVNPSYTISRTEEANVIAVLGSGQEDLRVVDFVESLDVSDSPINRIERTHDARQQSTMDALEDEGNEKLEELKANESFIFETLDTDSVKYGLDYMLGDFVTAEFESIQRDKQVIGVDGSISEGRESIRITFGDVS